VYAAWDVRLKREVAVKTLRHDIHVSHALLERFELEAEAVAKLRHPHIVPIYWVGEGDGVAFFIMPLIEGESLASVLERREPLPIPEACRILREAASALAAAHRAGIIHRDVKPENIMLEGPERRVVVMDFGIAKLTDTLEGGLTGTGMVVGTPRYMSPEQALGHVVDHRADQYALATVGYQMLTGQAPFDAPSVQTLMYRQATEAATPIASLRPDVPPQVAAAVERAMSKDPARRFDSMYEFAAAIAPAADGDSGPVVSRRRRVPSDRARAADARATVTRWLRPGLLAASLGAVALIATQRANVPAAGIALGAGRAEAVFAARQFVESRGVPAAGPVVTELVEQDSVYAFLRRAGATDTADVQARAASLGVWRWTVRAFDIPRDESWHVDVSTGRRIVRWERIPGESASTAALTPAAARALAESELRARGWDPGALRAHADAAPAGIGRGDHLFAWAVPGVVARAGGDGATREVRVSVRGDRVAGYEELVRLPPSFRAASLSPAARRAISIGAWIIAVGALLLSVVIAIRRGRVDDLQWRTALRLCALPLAVFLVMVSVEAYKEAVVPEIPDPDNWTDVAIGYAFVIPGLTLLLIFVAAAAESLAYAQRPSLLAGLHDIVRGRVLIPEMATATLTGYAAGLALLGARSALHALAYAIGVSAPAGVAEAFAWTFPSAGALAWLALAVGSGIALLYAASLFTRLRLPRPVTLALPAVLYGLLMLGSGSAPVELVLLEVLTMAALLALLWRFGTLAVVMALYVCFALPQLLALLRSGAPELVVAALAGLALLALPAALGVGAWRRVGRAG
jgi:serine/threonine-protein kinase